MVDRPTDEISDDDLDFVLIDEVRPPPRIMMARERLLLCRLYVGLIRTLNDAGVETLRDIERRQCVPHDGQGQHPGFAGQASTPNRYDRGDRGRIVKIARFALACGRRQHAATPRSPGNGMIWLDTTSQLCQALRNAL